MMAKEMDLDDKFKLMVFTQGNSKMESLMAMEFSRIWTMEESLGDNGKMEFMSFETWKINKLNNISKL